MSVTSEHIVVATNPQAAFGKNSRAGMQVVSALTSAGYQVTHLEADNYELLNGKVRLALRSSPYALVVVGGDGMVSLAVNHLAQTSIPFALVASGTGNDLARGLGLPVGNLSQSIDALVNALSRDPQRIDLGRITSADTTKVRWFACILSAGFDAIVNERANAMRRPQGKSRYIIALLRELFRLKPVRYTLTVDDHTTQEDAMLVSIANNRSMGGGMKVTPQASLRDGVLDVFILKQVSRARFLWLFPRVFKGTHVGEPEVMMMQGKKVHLEGPPIVAYADGEAVWSLPVDVDVVPGAVRMFM